MGPDDVAILDEVAEWTPERLSELMGGRPDLGHRISAVGTPSVGDFVETPYGRHLVWAELPAQGSLIGRPAPDFSAVNSATAHYNYRAQDDAYVTCSAEVLSSESDAVMLAIAVLRGGDVAPLIDALLEASHEPDGDEPVTDEWLKEGFGAIRGLRLGSTATGTKTVEDASGRILFGKINSDGLGWTLWSDLRVKVRTRRDARAIIRMGGYK